MDSEGNVFYKYDPSAYNTYGDIISYQLGENEELFGIYGSYGNESRWFTTFGFIVKVKANN